MKKDSYGALILMNDDIRNHARRVRVALKPNSHNRTLLESIENLAENCNLILHREQGLEKKQ